MASWLERIKSQISTRGKAEPPAGDPDYRVLFVCMGNICRSPTVEGVFRAFVAREFPERLIHIDSAGTHAYHVGQPPDPRAQNAAMRRGIDARVAAEPFEVGDGRSKTRSTWGMTLWSKPVRREKTSTFRLGASTVAFWGAAFSTLADHSGVGGTIAS